MLLKEEEQLEEKSSQLSLRVLKKRSEFKFVSKHGKTIFSRSFLLQVAKSDRLFFNEKCNIHYGITVSRKAGCAVVRNRIKRMLKVAVQNSFPFFCDDLCYVIICRYVAYNKSVNELQKELVFCLNKSYRIFTKDRIRLC